jgi:hypothetical protein
VKLILVILDQVLYPVANERPVVVVIENVVPAGGLTKPIDVKSVSDVNPLIINPLASCPEVLT